MRRRKFLELCAGAAIAPTIWIPKLARSQTEAFAAARHLLILFARGGLRSHALFNAVGTVQHNPWGAQPSAAGTEWSLGAVSGAEDIVTTTETIPSFASITNEVAVIPCVDHTPGEEIAEVDHFEGSMRIGTGSPAGKNGLLSIIGRHHPAYAGGWIEELAPPVDLGGPSPFALGTGDYERTRPLSLFDARDLSGGGGAIGRGWKIDARRRLDERFFAAQAPAYRARIDGYRLAKDHTYLYADMLGDPRLSVVNSPDAADRGFSNAALLEILGDHLLSDIGDQFGFRSWGANVAMALRFFTFGSPACVVTNPIYDLHFGEWDNLPPRSRDLTRQLAGLAHVLKRMPHDAGGTFWDRTVVAVVSEFSRNNTDPTIGFNSGAGSDHVERDPAPCRNQAVALMGGPIAGRGKLIGATDDQMQPLGDVYGSRALLATFLDLLGIEHTAHFPEEPIRGLTT